MTAQQFITSVGRLVGGDVYEANEKDAAGNVRVVKSGPNTGKPNPVYEFAVAFPKNGTQHFSQLTAQLPNGQTCPFGQLVYAAGQTGFPQGQWQMPHFAWKVTDGDSQIPNTRGRKPCDRPGYPGNWVFWFSSSFAPRIVNKDGSGFVLDKNAVAPGDYVQVAGSVSPNGDQLKPGVYLNHNVVSIQGFGEKIVSGPDPSAMGFGAAAPPAGMSAAPVAGMGASAPAVAPAPTPATGTPWQPPQAVAPPVAAAPFVAPPVQQVAVTPHPSILTAPAVPTVPIAPVRQMTAKAGGVPYENFIANKWTDDLLRSNGYML